MLHLLRISQQVQQIFGAGPQFQEQRQNLFNQLFELEAQEIARQRGLQALQSPTFDWRDT